MKKLEFQATCLDGQYCFVAQYDDILSFEIKTDIEVLENKDGQLDLAMSKQFIELLEKSSIEKWEKSYDGDSSAIEDALKWSVKYQDDDKIYFTKGEESFEPYNYEYLIKAIMICDDKAEYFLI